MEMSEKRKEQLNKMPVIETTIRRSKDGKYVLHRTVITDIKPVGYYEKVLDDAAESA